LKVESLELRLFLERAYPTAILINLLTYKLLFKYGVQKIPHREFVVEP